MVITLPSSLSETVPSINFSMSALDTNLEKAYSLLAEVIKGPDISKMSEIGPGSEIFERLRTVIAGIATGGMSSLADSGHRYAIGVAAKGLGLTNSLREQLGGVESVVFMNQLLNAGDDGIREALGKIVVVVVFFLFFFGTVGLINNQIITALNLANKRLFGERNVGND